MTRTASAFGLGIVVGLAGWSLLSAPPAPKDNAELAKLYAEDQNDRQGTIDWAKVEPRDRAREKRVKEMIAQQIPQTGRDYYNAAMVLQHAPRSEDHLLAHELCTVGIAKGEARAKWLSAASLDRYLMNQNKPQRWGTQYRSEGHGPIKLWKVEPGVTDAMRKAMGVPTLAEAKKREAMFNRKP